MTFPPKARSVTADGLDDGFGAPLRFRGEVSPDGATRLVVSAPPEPLLALLRGFVELMEPPLSVRWVRLTDRPAGRQLPQPESWVAVGHPVSAVLDTLEACPVLLAHDARGQLWVRGALGDVVVVDELGLLYAYPDDPLTRDTLRRMGVPEHAGPTMLDRDYVRVELLAEADAQEALLVSRLSLQRYG